MRKVNRYVPRYGGKPLPGILAVLVPVILVAAAGITWYAASERGGYSEIERLGSVKCLGCLGLNPNVPGFSGEFWVNYPPDHEKAGEPVPHPRIVRDILSSSEYDMLILFFWAQGCVPCAEQWEEMREKNIASGQEEGGRQGDAFEGLRMISVDANRDPDHLYSTYLPTGREDGVPMTTFLFRGGGGEIEWYSHYGKMAVGDVENMIDRILYHEISRA